MIDSEKLLSFLKKKKINFFTGVPDSTLKNFTKLIENDNSIDHYPVYNEGSAVSLGIGYHLATNKMAIAYLQNSGLSNAINPLISIAHKRVYSIPLFLLIGWRGSPHVEKDEPQHNLKGEITEEILKLLNIRYLILRKEKDLKKITKLINYGKKNKQPIACLIERKTLKLNKILNIKKNNYKFSISRENFIKFLLTIIDKKTKIISTTGYSSREIYKIRKNKNFKKGKDFYMIGGMGHSGMVSLGVSLNKKNQVICIDGDGSLLMHFGSLKAQGMFGKSNFKHILLNNASHESVGGQRTFTENLPFTKIAKLLGYKYVDIIKDNIKMKKQLKNFIKSKGPSFLEIKIKEGAIKNLGRPKNFINIKNNFKK
jgi:phosphonopyruvate decarboxylase